MWQTGQRAEGIDYTIIDGRVTFEGNVCAGVHASRFARSRAYDAKAVS